MKADIEDLSRKYSELISSNFSSFNSIKAMKNIMGVYIIYSPEGKILYIGSTNKFNIRFGTDLKHETTHTLTRKFLKRGRFLDRKQAVDFISTECKFQIQICTTKREAEALEHFAIWVLDPEYNKI